MKKLKIVSFVMITTIITIVSSFSTVEAALQANPNTQYKDIKTGETWAREFREMEQSGQGMGLSETLNDDLTASSGSNNIDVHMMRSTEYGAIAILSASGYGNPSNDNAITSTTGNKTGVMLNTAHREMVAGVYESRYFTKINAKYYDAYGDRLAKAGDALGNATDINPGCRGWHLATPGSLVVANEPILVRGISGIFGYTTQYYSQEYYSRGVAVCGKGI
ncbi:MAG: hypothetical protein HFJ34_04135 [Clostridia bacterium]|nr:hypothetical protein [Clostridia bacterium]